MNVWKKRPLSAYMQRKEFLEASRREYEESKCRCLKAAEVREACKTVTQDMYNALNQNFRLQFDVNDARTPLPWTYLPYCRDLSANFLLQTWLSDLPLLIFSRASSHPVVSYQPGQIKHFPNLVTMTRPTQLFPVQAPSWNPIEYSAWTPAAHFLSGFDRKVNACGLNCTWLYFLALNSTVNIAFSLGVREYAPSMPPSLGEHQLECFPTWLGTTACLSEIRTPIDVIDQLTSGDVSVPISLKQAAHAYAVFRRVSL